MKNQKPHLSYFFYKVTLKLTKTTQIISCRLSEKFGMCLP